MRNNQFLKIYGLKVLQITVFVLAFLLIQSTAKAQTALEKQCFNDVQGKVAWSQAGNKIWGETNIRSLCGGTTNPGATIACFQAQIQQHNDWNRGIAACRPTANQPNPGIVTAPASNKIVEEKIANPVGPENVRTVKLKNSSSYVANLTIRSANQPDDARLLSLTKDLLAGMTDTASANTEIAGNIPLLVEVRMKSFNPANIVIYRGIIAPDTAKTNFCFEAKQDAYKPSATTCEGTRATEAKKIEFRNEAGFGTIATLSYFIKGVEKTIYTDDIALGINRVFYIPTDADKDRDITLKTTLAYLTGRVSLRNITVDRDSGSTPCYKVWGIAESPKVGVCSSNASARKIKIVSHGAFTAQLEIIYVDQKQNRKTIKSNYAALLETDEVEIPSGLSNTPIEVNFSAIDGITGIKKFHTTTVPANFSGEVCFKTEGTLINPTAATCDNELNVMQDAESRQIQFKNEGGYDAQIIVQYVEIQNVGGTKIPIPKVVASGFINLGKNRIITVPKNTAPNTPITIILQGNGTLKNDIWSTTLPADFKSSPVQCFKTWDTLFAPKGGKCS